jgi:hypothetical protein
MFLHILSEPLSWDILRLPLNISSSLDHFVATVEAITKKHNPNKESDIPQVFCISSH